MRDYKKEIAKRSEKYTEFRAFIDKDLHSQLKAKLQSQGISMAQWVSACAMDYLQKK